MQRLPTPRIGPAGHLRIVRCPAGAASGAASPRRQPVWRARLPSRLAQAVQDTEIFSGNRDWQLFLAGRRVCYCAVTRVYAGAFRLCGIHGECHAPRRFSDHLCMSSCGGLAELVDATRPATLSCRNATPGTNGKGMLPKKPGARQLQHPLTLYGWATDILRRIGFHNQLVSGLHLCCIVDACNLGR